MDIEKYIRENRSDLNRIEPIDPEYLWMDFKGRKGRNRLRPFLWYTAAASLILLLGIGIGHWMSTGSDQVSPLIVENQYESLLNQKWSELEKNVPFNPNDHQALLAALKESQDHQNHLKLEYEWQSEKERILELLKREYERQLKLIELLEREIKLSNHGTQEQVKL